MIGPHPVVLRDLGRTAYEDVFAAMQAFTQARGPQTEDEIYESIEHAKATHLEDKQWVRSMAGGLHFQLRADSDFCFPG